MADPNTMASQRPAFQQRPSGSAHAFSPPFSDASPANGVNFPSPVHHSPSTSFAPLPATKRPRISTDQQPSYGNPSFSLTEDSRTGSQPNGMLINGTMPAPPAPGLMGPPSRPVDKATDIRTLEDTLAGTGVNIDEEERNLTAGSFPPLGPPTNSSFQSHNLSFGPNSANGSFDRPSPVARQESGYGFGTNNYGASPATEQLTAEEIERRRENDANWQAARQRQHPLWHMFLQGDPLERRLTERTYEHGISSPKEGLYYAQKGMDRPQQRTRVNGLDGASVVIDQGETILSTQSGSILGDIMKLISLATKERITGILDLSARLSKERQDHSKGRVPTEWEPVAVVPATTSDGPEGAATPVAATSLKRTHSQASGDDAGSESVPAPHRIADVFRKVSQAEKAAEDGRIAKRARRNASTNPEAGRSGSVSFPGGAEIAKALLAETDKKPTKKDRKLAESKFTEAQQHKSANETARMAVGGLAALGAKKGKVYSWMTGGASTPKSVSSPAPTPSKPNAATIASPSSTPNATRAAASSQRRQFGQWDESKDPGIQARDVLLVLETDGKASRSLLRGYNNPES